MSPATALAGIQLDPVLTQAGIKGLVFDLDGTLIDSAADILGGVRDTLRIAGYGELPQDYFASNMHGTSGGILRSVIEDMGWQPPEDVSELREIYYQVYAARDHRETTLYPDVLPILEECAQTMVLGICTNKIHRNAMAALDKFGITSYFKVISGADTFVEAKPSPLPLLETIRQMGLTPDECLYFGDTMVDAECAARAGVRFLLHTAGYGDPVLYDMQHYRTFDHWRELMRA